MIPPLPRGRETAQPDLPPSTRTPKPVAATRLAALLRANASAEEIRDRLLPSFSYDAVRSAVLRCAASDEFVRSLADALPDALDTTAHSVLESWRNQDHRVPDRERFRSLRRLVADLDRLAETVAALREARPTS